MIRTKRCEFLTCKRPLESVKEIGIGLCNRHYKKFKDSDYLTLCCWNCGSKLETIHKHKFLKGVVVKDDYIFTKTCPNCSNVHMDDLQYITIDNTTDKSTKYFIGKNGVLRKKKVNSRV